MCSMPGFDGKPIRYAALHSQSVQNSNLHANWPILWNQPLLYIEGLLFMDFDNVTLSTGFQVPINRKVGKK